MPQLSTQPQPMNTQGLPPNLAQAVAAGKVSPALLAFITGQQQIPQPTSQSGQPPQPGQPATPPQGPPAPGAPQPGQPQPPMPGQPQPGQIPGQPPQGMPGQDPQGKLIAEQAIKILANLL